MRKTRGKFSGSAGTTLVEMLATLALIGILMVMVIGVLSPTAKVFVRMQRLQFAQLILDNVEDEIKGQLLQATEYVKIYGNEEAQSSPGSTPSGAAYTEAQSGAGETQSGAAYTEAQSGTEETQSGAVYAEEQPDSEEAQSGDGAGAGSGPVLEYIHTSGYVTVMSAGGCDATEILRGGDATGTEAAVPGGRMLMRYYLRENAVGSSLPYQYTVSKGAKQVARAVHTSFTDKYYMGSYLKLTFSFPEGVAAGKKVPYLNIKAELYQDEACTELLAAEEFTAELRYQAVRTDSQTAKAAAGG